MSGPQAWKTLVATRHRAMRCAMLFALGLCAPASGVSQGRPDSVTVALRVFDSADGEALDSVVVLIPALAVRLVSDSFGQVLFEGIGVGTYDMILIRTGYREGQGRFTVDREGSLQIGLSVLANIRVTGTVHARESGDPLSGAIVRIEGVAPLLTDDRGRFVAEAVPRGRHAVEVEYLGRAPTTDTLVLEGAELVHVDIRLEERPFELAGLDVVVQPRSLGLESAGFYDRRDRWQVHGVWLTREDIEEHLRPQMADYFINTPGATIERSGFDALLKITRYGRPCDPITYVDGVRRGHGYNLNTLPPDVIEGVEIYVGQRAPIQFRSDACGVVLFWTRGYR